MDDAREVDVVAGGVMEAREGAEGPRADEHDEREDPIPQEEPHPRANRHETPPRP